MEKYFLTDPPARNIVPVSDLGVPGIRIGISLIAYVAGDGPPKRTIYGRRTNSDRARTASGSGRTFTVLFRPDGN